jgi:para-nitrobenzyl esterase
MKTAFTLLFLFFVSIHLQAQRYIDKVFTNVSMDSVTYGNAKTWNDVSQDLLMNIYQPDGDTAMHRPLIVLAHGGAFISGNRYSPDIDYLCTAFAKRGYICVSISYRLGIDISKFFLEPGPQFANAVWRGTLDGRAAIRYLRANALNYRIDTAQIYLGGVSAGGVLGLHEAFLDEMSEVAASNPPFDTAAIGGGIEGLSGTPGQSWRVKGIISLCGGIGNAEWMSNNRGVAIFSVHGTNDETVPYKTDYFKAYNTDIALLSGGFIVDSMAHVYGMKSFLYTFEGAPHVPFAPGVGTQASSDAYMDTTENLLRDFLADDLNRHVGIHEVLAQQDVSVFPNPASERVTVHVEKGKNNRVEVLSVTGQLMLLLETQQSDIQLNTSMLKPGIYWIRVGNELGKTTRKIVVI